MNVLEIKNVSKTFSASNIKANNNITLELRKGEILCIAGENGAGKTTLMKILCGLEKQDSGEIIKNGNTGMVHQHFILFSGYTVAENIVFGYEPRRAGIFLDSKKAVIESQKILNENNFNINAAAKVNELMLGEMQQVEICRILYRNADILIMDEPTSILTEAERESLFKTLKKLAGNGKSIILITHKLREIKQIADRVAVLRNGDLAGVRRADEIDLNDIASMMISGDKTPKINASSKKQTAAINGGKIPVIVFDNVTVIRNKQKKPLLDRVSFSVNSGEILGFTGAGGNGLGVIEAVLGGFLHPVSGRILHNGKDITKISVTKLREQGLSYVPADRVNVGSAQDAAIWENIIINKRRLIGKNKNLIKKMIDDYIKSFDIKTPCVREKASSLSGGNLQKLIIARETDCLKDYIVFSHPVWGLDFGSSEFVINKIMEIRDKGAAVILISNDLDHIIQFADRIIVMYRGKIAGEYINKKEELIKDKINSDIQGINNEKL